MFDISTSREKESGKIFILSVPYPTGTTQDTERSVLKK